jgi:hypothetical protein
MPQGEVSLSDSVTINPIATLKAYFKPDDTTNALNILPLVRGSTTFEAKVRCAFRQEFTLEDAIGSHTCSLEALACV